MKTTKEMRTAALFQCRKLVPKYEAENIGADALSFGTEAAKRSTAFAIVEKKGTVTTHDHTTQDGVAVTVEVYAFSERELIEYTRAVQEEALMALASRKMGEADTTADPHLKHLQEYAATCAANEAADVRRKRVGARK